MDTIWVWTKELALWFCSCLVQIADASVKKIKYLRLNVRDFAPGELKLVEGHISLSEVSKESKFFGSHDQEGVALPALTASCTTHTMNVLFRIIWRIELEKKNWLRPISKDAWRSLGSWGNRGPSKKWFGGVLTRFGWLFRSVAPHPFWITPKILPRKNSCGIGLID